MVNSAFMLRQLTKGFLLFLACSFAGSSLQAAVAKGEKRLLPLGSAAPDFTLPDVVTGKPVKLSDFKDKKVLLVVILCRHCPYVKHIRKDLAKFARNYAGKDVAIVGISANDPKAYPEDRPESLKVMAQEEGFLFPILFDESQDVARAFAAVATPDFLLFDKDRKLVYRGQYDDTRPKGHAAANGKDVRAAVDAMLADQPVSSDQKPAMGCSVKWK